MFFKIDKNSQYAQENTSVGVSFQYCNFIKRRLQHSCFPVNIVKFLRTAFSIEYLRWPPLNNYFNTRNTLQSRKFRRSFYISIFYQVYKVLMIV